MHLHQSTSHVQQTRSPLLQRQHPMMPSWVDQIVPIEDPRVINRLVNNLMYLFNIKEGDYLTFVLGHGECTQNKDAIKHWVLEELADTPISQDDVLEYLVSQLKEQLLLEVYQ
ncbi:MAG: hypothetical protein JXK16_03010 [Thiotrichales bacterium]|nr:hypothetical protein [Thiotrichales bacterium]